jgi:hypothetical protein
MQVMRQVPSAAHVPTPASAQSDGHASTALIARASPASASESGASAEPSPSPSRAAVASAASVVESVVDDSCEPNVTSGNSHAAATRPPAARSGAARSTIRERVRRSKAAAPSARTGPRAERAIGRRFIDSSDCDPTP